MSDSHESASPPPTRKQIADIFFRSGSLKDSQRLLVQYYHLPLREATKQLGVSATSLKKVCRMLGVKRWPHRKLQKLDIDIRRLREELATNIMTESIRAEKLALLHETERKRAEILENPNVPLAQTAEKRRRPFYQPPQTTPPPPAAPVELAPEDAVTVPIAADAVLSNCRAAA